MHHDCHRSSGGTSFISARWSLTSKPAAALASQPSGVWFRKAVFVQWVVPALQQQLSSARDYSAGLSTKWYVVLARVTHCCAFIALWPLLLGLMPPAACIHAGCCLWQPSSLRALTHWRHHALPGRAGCTYVSSLKTRWKGFQRVASSAPVCTCRVARVASAAARHRQPAVASAASSLGDRALQAGGASARRGCQRQAAAARRLGQFTLGWQRASGGRCLAPCWR